MPKRLARVQGSLFAKEVRVARQVLPRRAAERVERPAAHRGQVQSCAPVGFVDGRLLASKLSRNQALAPDEENI